MEAPSAPPPIGPESDPAATPLARVAGVFGFPGQTFESIARRPGWVVPLILLTLLSLAATAAILPRLDVESAVRESLAKRQVSMPEERVEQVVEAQKRFAGLFGYVWALCGPTIIVLVLALVFWLAFKAFGWDLAFRQAFGAGAHAMLPTMIGSMLLIFFATREDVINPADLRDLTHTNLGPLVDRTSNPVLHSIAGSLDVTTLWSLGLFVIGFAAAAKVPRKRAAVLIGGLWAAYVLGKAGVTALFS